MFRADLSCFIKVGIKHEFTCRGMFERSVYEFHCGCSQVAKNAQWGAVSKGGDVNNRKEEPS